MKLLRSPSGLLAFINCVVVLHAAAAPSGHRMLIGVDSKGRIDIVEPDGRISWEEKIGPIHDLSQLPNGNILFQQSGTKIAEMTPDHKIVWSYESAVMNGNAGNGAQISVTIPAESSFG